MWPCWRTMPSGRFSPSRPRYERGKEVASNADGRFVVTEAPRFFKLRMDSDLATPYGEPMQGTLIYLNQQPQPGLLVSTMRLAGASHGS